ncbi:hypothetical protein GQ42DRAFT_178237 [Ramicandelaber brevisporus]|nr:hypothetical protein GQ42DRAFT_178237 [Ramicandelaber brevisporus]
MMPIDLSNARMESSEPDSRVASLIICTHSSTVGSLSHACFDNADVNLLHGFLLFSLTGGDSRCVSVIDWLLMMIDDVDTDGMVPAGTLGNTSRWCRCLCVATDLLWPSCVLKSDVLTSLVGNLGREFDAAVATDSTDLLAAAADIDLHKRQPDR